MLPEAVAQKGWYLNWQGGREGSSRRWVHSFIQPTFILRLVCMSALQATGDIKKFCFPN